MFERCTGARTNAPVGHVLRAVHLDAAEELGAAEDQRRRMTL